MNVTELPNSTGGEGLFSPLDLTNSTTFTHLAFCVVCGTASLVCVLDFLHYLVTALNWSWVFCGCGKTGIFAKLRSKRDVNVQRLDPNSVMFHVDASGEMVLSADTKHLKENDIVFRNQAYTSFSVSSLDDDEDIFSDSYPFATPPTPSTLPIPTTHTGAGHFRVVSTDYFPHNPTTRTRVPPERLVDPSPSPSPKATSHPVVRRPTSRHVQLRPGSRLFLPNPSPSPSTTSQRMSLSIADRCFPQDASTRPPPVSSRKKTQNQPPRPSSGVENKRTRKRKKKNKQDTATDKELLSSEAFVHPPLALYKSTSLWRLKVSQRAQDRRRRTQSRKKLCEEEGEEGAETDRQRQQLYGEEGEEKKQQQQKSRRHPHNSESSFVGGELTAAGQTVSDWILAASEPTGLLFDAYTEDATEEEETEATTLSTNKLVYRAAEAVGLAKLLEAVGWWSLTLFVSVLLYATRVDSLSTLTFTEWFVLVPLILWWWIVTCPVVATAKALAACNPLVVTWCSISAVLGSLFGVQTLVLSKKHRLDLSGALPPVVVLVASGSSPEWVLVDISTNTREMAVVVGVVLATALLQCMVMLQHEYVYSPGDPTDPRYLRARSKRRAIQAVVFGVIPTGLQIIALFSSSSGHFFLVTGLCQAWFGLMLIWVSWRVLVVWVQTLAFISCALSLLVTGVLLPTTRLLFVVFPVAVWVTHSLSVVPKL
jgi:hypothetical protein